MNRRHFLQGILAGLPIIPLVLKEKEYVEPHKLYLTNDDLKDIFISCETLEDMKKWSVSEIDFETRKAIFNSDGPKKFPPQINFSYSLSPCFKQD